MSKRLQVLFPEHEWREIKRLARAQHLTVAEWVRQALRAMRQQVPDESAERKLRAVRDAVRRSYPTGDITEMLAEIEHGYGDDSR
jgi:methylmalonyl-CoA mutase N-terminal domain/subunit